MKKSLVILALLVGAHAHAVVPLKPIDAAPAQALEPAGGDPFGLQDFLDQLFKPLFIDADWSPEDERERLQDMLNSDEPMQFMTPEELAEEYGIPYDYSAQDNAEYLWEKSAGGVALSINVSIARQTLTMTGTYTPTFTSVVSTGIEPTKKIKKGKPTVRGCFRPTLLSPNHKSKKYGGSPMNWSVFFYGGYALHETPYVKQLGTPASHGCVRQNRASAKYVYQTVKWYRDNYGNGTIRICVK